MAVKTLGKWGPAIIVCHLTACGSGGNSAVDLQERMLRVEGKVATAGAENAQITVTAGPRQFTTSTDSTGNYSIELTLDGGEDTPVFALAQLTTDPTVELVSYLGSFGALVVASGDDATLSAQENIRNNVSSLSTAEAVLVEEAFDMVPPTAAIGRGADPATALDLASALSLILSDRQRFPLPDNAPTTLALARDAEARQAYIDSLTQNAADDFLQSKIGLIANPDIVRALTPAEVPARLVMSAAPFESPGYSPFPQADSDIEYQANGQGTGNGSTEFAWTTEGTFVRARFTQYTGLGGDDMIDCNGDGTPEWVSYNYRSDGFDLVVLGPAAAVTVAKTTLDHQYCPDDPGAEWTAVNAFTISSLTPAQSAP